jgi:K(+)-stimulated pyrophosphate-energized sodium pump
MEFLQNNLIYLIPAMGVFGIVIMAIKSAWVTKQDPGDENMQRLSGYIADGAMAFLKAEWKVLGYFSVIAAILLAYSGTLVETSSWVIAISFVMLRMLVISFTKDSAFVLDSAVGASPVNNTLRL